MKGFRRRVPPSTEFSPLLSMSHEGSEPDVQLKITENQSRHIPVLGTGRSVRQFEGATGQGYWVAGSKVGSKRTRMSRVYPV
jgi:hypothetical protein